MWFFKLGDRLWHSDSSLFRPVPAKYSLLSKAHRARLGRQYRVRRTCARRMKPWTSRTKEEVEELVCEHSLLYSRQAVGFTEFTPEEIDNFQPVRHPLVRVQKATGRKSLFLSAHAGAIVGWSVPEARAFLRDLTEHATSRAFVYSHSWQRHDLVVWDNRTLMHRARRFDHATRCATCAAQRLAAKCRLSPDRACRRSVRRRLAGILGAFTCAEFGKN